MQTASAALTTALTSRERTVVARVRVDWNRDGSYSFDPGVARDIAADTVEGIGDIGDVSAWVESLSVDRSLSTDLPEGSKVVSGYGAAEASVVLAGATSGGVALGSALSSLSGGAKAWRRLGAPVTVDVGAVGADGPEYLRQFTGRIRSVEVSTEAARVTLTALDGREKLRTPVRLPVVVGQNGDYFINQIVTQNGLSITSEGSLNASLSTPAAEGSDPWGLLQLIAAAENGVVLFDENDTLRFYNRNHMAGGAAVATITTDPAGFANLKAASAGESLDTIANYVTVGAVPLTLDPPGTVVWTLAEAPVAVLPYSSVTLPAEFVAPLYAAASITFAAQRNPDGTGGSVASSIWGHYTSVTATTGTITFHNTGSVTAYLVNTTGSPAASLTGQLLRPADESGYSSTWQHSGSQAQYGKQSLDVPANVWRQSREAADALGMFLLQMLADPHPTLPGVDIAADPRLQLADRVRIQEPTGMQVDADYWLVGITTRFSTSEGLAQTVTVREAA